MEEVWYMLLGDLGDELHLLYLIEVLNVGQVLHRHHHRNFLKSAGKLGGKNDRHSHEGDHLL